MLAVILEYRIKRVESWLMNKILVIRFAAQPVRLTTKENAAQPQLDLMEFAANCQIEECNATQTVVSVQDTTHAA